jgi:hypothetical protein
MQQSIVTSDSKVESEIGICVGDGEPIHQCHKYKSNTIRGHQLIFLINHITSTRRTTTKYNIFFPTKQST